MEEKRKNTEKDGKKQSWYFLKVLKEDLVCSIQELTKKPNTELDEIQVEQIKRQYSYISIVQFLIHSYYLAVDVLNQRIKFYSLNLTILIMSVLVVCNTRQSNQNYSRVVMGLFLMLSPVVMIERGVEIDYLKHKHSMDLLFVISQIFTISILVNQRFLIKCIISSVFNSYVIFKLFLAEKIRVFDVTVFLFAHLILLLRQAINTAQMRDHVSQMLKNHKEKQEMARDTSLLMKVVVSSPVYIVEITHFQAAWNYCLSSNSGTVAEEDQHFLKNVVLDGKLNYFDPDDTMMNQVSVETLLKFLDQIYFDEGSSLEVKNDVLGEQELLTQSFQGSKTFTKLDTLTKLPLVLREKIFEDGLKHFMNQNVGFIFTFVYKLLIDFKMSDKFFTISLKDVNNKLELDQESDLKFYDIEISFMIYHAKQSIVIKMQDATGRYQVRALQSQNQKKETYLASVVHDMRAPLHVINGFSDHIQEQLKISDPLGLLPDMSAIKRNGEHLNHLIDDILDYTRIKKGKMHLDISRFYLRTLFEDCKLTIDEILRQKNPSGQKNAVLFEIEGGQFDVSTDLNRLKRVLLNFLTNSVKFTLKGCIKLEGSLSKDRKFVEIKITDDGVGMSEMTKNNLFKAFNSYQDKSGTLNKDGIGLGLATSLSIVQMLGTENSISVRSELGRGSEFAFKIFCHLTSQGAAYTSKSARAIKQGDSVRHLLLSQIDQLDGNSLVKDSKVYSITPDPRGEHFFSNQEEIRKTKSDMAQFRTKQNEEFTRIRKHPSNNVLPTEERSFLDDDSDNDSEIFRKQLSQQETELKNLKEGSPEKKSWQILILDDEKLNADLLQLQIKRFGKLEGIEDKLELCSCITFNQANSEHTGTEFVRKVKQIYGSQSLPQPYSFLISGEEVENIPEFDQVLQKSYKFESFSRLMKQWYSHEVQKNLQQARALNPLQYCGKEFRKQSTTNRQKVDKKL